MTQLDLGRLGVWGHLDTLAAPDVIAYARRAEELGYGTLWVPETVGREPIALCSPPGGRDRSDQPRHQHHQHLGP